MVRLVVIAGPANSGKLAKAWEIAATDPNLRLLHRDQVRVLFGRLLDEWNLTGLLGVMAEHMLRCGYGVVTAAQNQCEEDRIMWQAVAAQTGAELEWVEMTTVYA